MKTFAQILNGALHWKFQAESRPDFAPNIELVDITGYAPEPVVGAVWDGKTFATPAAPSDDKRAIGLKDLRDSLIERTDWLVQRHRDEKDMNRPTTMSGEAFAELLEYRQTLRDFPVAEGFPNLELPALPAGIAEILESR